MSYDGNPSTSRSCDDVRLICIEMSEHESDDSSSHVRRSNSIYSSVLTRSAHPPSNELLTFDSPYPDSNTFLPASSRTSASRLVHNNTFSSSSSSTTANDDHGSSSELDYCTLVSAGMPSSAGNAKHLEFGHHQHQWLDNQSLTGHQ